MRQNDFDRLVASVKQAGASAADSSLSESRSFGLKMCGRFEQTGQRRRNLH